MAENARNDYSSRKFVRQGQLFRREFRRRGCGVRQTRNIVEIRLGGKCCFLLETETSFTSLLAFRTLKDKRIMRDILQEQGLNVAEGEAFRGDETAKAFALVKELGLAVIKPADGRKGQGVSVSVTPDNFDAAWAAATKAADTSVLVERCFERGIEARYFVLEGRCIAVHSRIPPFIVGDGAHDVAALVARRNDLRRTMNPSRINADVVLDAHRLALLAKQGFASHSVIPAGEKLLIDWKAGISTGGDTENITESVHPEMLRVAEAVFEAIPGLDIYGVDIIADDHAAPPSDRNYIVVEANTRPGIRGHQYPDFGEPIDICKLVVESVVRRLEAS